MLTRRAFLKSGALSLFAAGLGGSPFFLGRTALATPGPGLFQRRKVLVTLFQRGAMDGLMAVTPFTDPYLARHRPRLAMTPAAGDEALIDLDGRFGLHPALSPLHPYFADGHLAIVHGTGSPAPTRSHFDAQDYMETGTPGRKGSTGWLNRAVGLLGHEPTPLQAVALAKATPRSLSGPHPSLAIADLETFGIAAPPAEAEDLLSRYSQSGHALLHDTSREGAEALRLLDSLRQTPYQPSGGARYPGSPLGRSLQQIARLIKADVGLEVAFAETGGWDTHARQGTTRGPFARQATNLARSIAAFWTDLGPYRDDVVLMTMTEFGRTVAENGAGGTDHGRASCLFVLGHDVSGGQVYGHVESLAPEALTDRRDLPVTTDFRSVFSGVAGPHLGLAPTEDADLFPDWSGDRMNLLR